MLVGIQIQVHSKVVDKLFVPTLSYSKCGLQRLPEPNLMQRASHIPPAEFFPKQVPAKKVRLPKETPYPHPADHPLTHQSRRPQKKPKSTTDGDIQHCNLLILGFFGVIQMIIDCTRGDFL
ncbi:hypothetical protein BJX70DRAFT_378623 [Aspergillus crustosus]